MSDERKEFEIRIPYSGQPLSMADAGKQLEKKAGAEWAILEWVGYIDRKYDEFVYSGIFARRIAHVEVR